MLVNTHVLIQTFQKYFTKNIYSSVRRLSGKYTDTVNSEAKTSNKMGLLLFVLLGTILQFMHGFLFQSVNS